MDVSKKHIEYLSDAQFTADLALLAETAAHEAERLAQMFSSISETAIVLLNEVRATSGNIPGGWRAYHSGVASGLVGDALAAQEMFDSVAEGFAQPDSLLAKSARRMAQLASATEDFKRQVSKLIGQHRSALRLPTLGSRPF